MSKHPDARITRAYSDAYGLAIRVGYSQAAAREYARAAAQRVNLLEALRATLDCLDPDADWPDGMLEAADQAEAAIAKATTGGTP